MKKKLEEAKLDLWVKLLKKSLIAHGVAYNPCQSKYLFTVGKSECSLTIKNGKIIVENHTAKRVDYYDFNSKVKDAILSHCRLCASDLDEVSIAHSDLYMTKVGPMITSSAAIIDTDVTQERCANKVLFFSDSLIGDTLHDTLANLARFDGSMPKSVTQDVPHRIGVDLALENMLRNEKRLILDMSERRTR